jgi:hypothetical protein
MREKDVLKEILGLNSMIRIFISTIFEKLFDTKYGVELRKGKNILQQSEFLNINI